MPIARNRTNNGISEIRCPKTITTSTLSPKYLFFNKYNKYNNVGYSKKLL